MSSTTRQGTTATPSSTVEIPAEKVAMRAYDKWCQGGCQQGVDQMNWYEAEAEIRREMMAAAKPTTQTAKPTTPAAKPTSPAQSTRR